MDPKDKTPESQPDPSQLNGAGEGGASKDGNPAISNDSLSLAEINALLGKDFKSKEAAMTSLKEANSFIGRKKDDILAEFAASNKDAEANNKLANELENMRKENFYDKNPQYAEPSIRKLIERIGGSPQEVVNSSEFKEVFERVKGYDESIRLRTVLESNPRIASSRDNLDKARELQANGGSQEEINKLVATAVLDAYAK